MIKEVAEYINSKLENINKTYCICEKVQENEKSYIKELGENGDIIDFDKVESLSYILPVGDVDGEQLEGDVGNSITQRLSYSINLVVYKQRASLLELDEIYKVIQQVSTNNNPELVSTSQAMQGAKISFQSATHNKAEIWERDFTGKDFRLKLSHMFFSIQFLIELDLDLECDFLNC